MRKPSDLTDEEARAEANLLRDRLRAADRVAAGLFSEQVFIHTATEVELRAALPAERVDEILAYRRSHGFGKEPDTDADELSRILHRAFEFIQQLLGPVNGIAQPLSARAFSGPIAPAKAGALPRTPVRMRHEGDPDEELVTFQFSRPIREAVLVRDGELVFHGHDLPTDARIDIWSEDVVRNPSDSSLDWMFVDDLEWRIDWSD